ncbi:N-6 DNA methylase [Blautia sp. DFI.4.84]|nr:N-6 DNA methylase [Blautia sp. DFI.4.84]
MAMQSGFIKRIRDIMRMDAGINGDAQRIEQMVWMLFLKVYDAKEDDWELNEDNYESIIPEDLRWRNWAKADGSGHAMTGDKLLNFVNNTLFPVLKGNDVKDGDAVLYEGIKVTPDTPIKKAIVKSTFEDANNYMKDGVYLRQVIDVTDEIEFDDVKESHAFGFVYEEILRELQSAGSSGEFYTPRAVTEFMALMIKPQLGEKMADFACGTGGFITSWLGQLSKQVTDTAAQKQLDDSIYGIEKKPFPYLLCVTNMLLHDIEVPNIYHMNSFLHIDIEAIRKEYLSAFQTPESTEAVVDGVKSLLGNILSEEQAAQFTVENVTNALSHGLTESFLNAALSLRDEVKKDTWSVCFSENGFNEVLWLKYADQHRGFVQIYDLENNDNFLCGKQEKCANCGIKNYGTPLYPIYYSDTPYDATKFAKFVMLRKIAETTATQIPPELYAGMGSALWEQERTTLIKKECHKYDEEWRMITGCIMKPPVMMEWIPSGIILGLRMDVAEENLVVSMAKEAGIKNIYKSYINAQNKLDAYPLKL